MDLMLEMGGELATLIDKYQKKGANIGQVIGLLESTKFFLLYRGATLSEKESKEAKE